MRTAGKAEYAIFSFLGGYAAVITRVTSIKSENKKGNLSSEVFEQATMDGALLSGVPGINSLSLVRQSSSSGSSDSIEPFELNRIKLSP